MKNATEAGPGSPGLVYAFGAAAAELASARPGTEIGHFTSALRTVGEAVRADRVYLFHFDYQSRLVSNTHEWCADGIESVIDQLQNLPMDHFQWSLEQLIRGETIDVPFVPAMPPEAEAERVCFESQDIRSIVLVPVGVAGRVRGFIGFDAVRNYRPWSDEEARLLIVLGGVFDATIGRLEAEKSAATDRACLEFSEQRFGQLLDVADDTIVLHDGDGRVLDINAAGLKRLGYTVSQISSLRVEDLEVGAPREELLKVWRDMLPGEARRIHGRHRRADGHVFPVSVSLAAFQDRQGEKQFVAVVRDVSEEQRLTDEIRETRERLRELLVREAMMQNMIKRDLAKRLHDKIGQELFLARLLLQNGLDATAGGFFMADSKRNELVSVLTQAIAESRSVMKDLNDPAGEELGLDAGIHSLASRIFGATRMVHSIRVEGDARAVDRLTAQHLLDILRELMINVVKHSCASRCEIGIRVVGQWPGVLAWVCDNGLGMPPEGHSEDAGLGTLFVRERIELLGGAVAWGVGLDGCGVGVRVSLPFHPAGTPEEGLS